MRDAVRRALPAAAGVGAGALAAVAAGPAVARIDAPLALLAYQAVVVAVGAVLGLAAVRVSWPRQDPPLPAEPSARAPVRLPELDALESLVADAARHAGHLHHRLRPRLRALAADALASRHVDLDDPHGPARTLLGEPAWRWLRPDLDPPPGRHGGGPGAAAVAEVVDAVARLHADATPHGRPR